MISWKQFDGEYPRTLPHLLPETAAQLAIDCDFTQNALYGLPIRVAVPGIAAAGTRSLYVHDSLNYSWFSWAYDVDAVRGPVAGDAYSRFYWTNGTNMYVSRSDLGSGTGEPAANNKYLVGVPRPASALFMLAEDVHFPLLAVLGASTVSSFCEKSDGSTSGETVWATYDTVEDSMARWSIHKTVALSCVAETISVAADPNAEPVWDTTTNLLVTPTATSSVTITSSPAVKIATAAGDIVLREDANASTFPADYGGYGGSISVADGLVTINVWVGATSPYVTTRAYTYTLVNQYGEEGSAAAPFEIELPENATIKLRYAPTPNGGHCPATKMRVYRTGGTGSSYLFVAELVISAADPVFTDDLLDSQLGEPLSTSDFYPPEAGLRGLTMLPNGVLAAFKGNEVHFSEPYMAYAWRTANIQTTMKSVMGICAAEGGLVVTTRENPYFISGITPDAMSQSKITAIQAGVSKGSICNIGAAVIYATNDGLVAVRGLDASLDLSFTFFTRPEWRRRYGDKLSKMRLSAHDGHLLAWFEDGTPGFLLRYDETNPSFTELSEPIYGAYVHPMGDTLYVASGSGIYEFKGGATTMPFEWWSKDFVMPKPVNLGAVQVVGSGAIFIEVFADGRALGPRPCNLTDTGSVVFRLPGGFLARRWSLHVDGLEGASVTEINMAVSPSEFQSV